MKKLNLSTTVLLIFLVFLISCLKNDSSFLNDVLNRDINSTIINKYINTENHNIPFLVYGGKDSIIVYEDWYEEINIGDSIIKPKNSLNITIKNSNKNLNFNYEDKFGLQ